MLLIKSTTRFQRDLRLAAKRGKNLDKMEAVVNFLQARKPLPPANRDHALSGDWHHHRECHIEPDWLLIYRVHDDVLFLERTGTHTDLFE